MGLNGLSKEYILMSIKPHYADLIYTERKAEESAKQQVAYSPKHLAGTETTQPGSLAQTGDRTDLIGETFAIGGTVLVAAGVFLDRKKRHGQM